MVNIYQHALPFTGELLEEVMKKRVALWRDVDKLLGAFPARASMVVGGDLNSVLEPAPPFAPRVFTGVPTDLTSWRSEDASGTFCRGMDFAP